MSSAPFDPDQPATYARHSEETPEGGKIVLVRYPEGYRLRFNGEVVWREDDKAARDLVHKSVTEALNDAQLKTRRGDVVMAMYEQCVGRGRKA